MVRILSDGDIADLLDLGALLPVIETAFEHQGRDAVERPARPHFPVGTGIAGDEPLGTGIVMPAYIHGATYYATKLVGVHAGNTDRGLPTVQAQIALTDAATGVPVAFMAGTRITNARTGCIGGLAARELAAPPIRLGLIGAGAQARWHARAIAAATTIEKIRVYSPSDSKFDCADDLAAELGIQTEAVDTPEAAVTDATVVVTATTATSPVFPGTALTAGTVVVAVGAYNASMQELDGTTMDRAARVFADNPEEVAEIGDVQNTGVDPATLIPFSDVFLAGAGRETDEEIIVVESVGTATLDAATAEHVYDAAEDAAVGVDVTL